MADKENNEIGNRSKFDLPIFQIERVEGTFAGKSERKTPSP